MMRVFGSRAHGERLRALIVLLWRAGLGSVRSAQATTSCGR